MFETERCMISTLRKADFSDVKKLYVNEDVRKYLGGIRQAASIEDALAEMLHSGDDSFYWVIRKKHTDNFMGMVSLDPHHDGVYYEVSYQILPDWWGVGYATEVVQVIINFALNELKLPKVIAETQTANTASCKLLEKLGMKLEGTINRFGAEQAIYSIK
ncbi:MAG: GNAT family N-acetyltransferase [Bacillus sp. (in: firmicutes)]